MVGEVEHREVLWVCIPRVELAARFAVIPPEGSMQRLTPVRRRFGRSP